MWILLSFANALTSGLENTYVKKTALHASPILVAWSIIAISAILFSPLLLLGIPHLTQTFWLAVGARLIIDSLAFTLYVTGVQRAPLSLAIPMVSLSPVFSLATVFFINHISPTPLGLAGVIAIVSGLYLLNFDHTTKHVLSPFLAVFHNRGVLFVAIAAILWAFVTSFMKLGVDNSTPYFYSASFQIIWAICFAPFAYFTNKRAFRALFRTETVKKLLPAGGLDALHVVVQNVAYVVGNPVYVNAVSSTSILFSSLFGWYFFGEKLQKHILPTALIVLGIICITVTQH